MGFVIMYMRQQGKRRKKLWATTIVVLTTPTCYVGRALRPKRFSSHNTLLLATILSHQFVFFNYSYISSECLLDPKDSANGNKLDNGLGCLDLIVLAWVNMINPIKLTTMPHDPKKVMGIPKTREVTMIANIRRIQFNTA